jgi:magnesium transporter
MPTNMHLYTARADGFQRTAPPCTPNDLVWLDYLAPHADGVPAFIAQISELTGVQLQTLHAQDAVNALHPSHYDGTAHYDMVVFRSLMGHEIKQVGAKKTRQLQAITTQPITFFISDHALVTVQHSALAQSQAQLHSVASKVLTQCTPHELMLRFLNAQVDAYLALRQPMTEQLDRWQRELLDPRRSFNDWTALLDARLELRKLEALSEEQLDALQELKEAWMEPKALPYGTDEIANLRVRLSDVMEHVGRVLNHARRLEDSVESAIQLHFASVSHATNKTVSRLTVMTAIFAPMTLLSGVYGMNVPLPWQTHAQAFSWIMAAMAISTISLLATFGGLKFWQNRRR